MKKLDRYSLLCISVALIIMLTVFSNREEPHEESVVGVVYDIKETQSGYTFFMEDSGGGRTKCFTRVEPIGFAVYFVKGTMSDDGGILFINSMSIVPQNELYHH